MWHSRGSAVCRLRCSARTHWPLMWTCRQTWMSWRRAAYGLPVEGCASWRCEHPWEARTMGTAEPPPTGQGPLELHILGLRNMPEVRPGSDLARLVLEAADASGVQFHDGDVVVVTHKVVSKAEGRLVDLRTVEPSRLAARHAAAWGKDPRQIEVVLCESARIVRMDRGIIISQTAHGFVCANAGVDASN